MKIDFELFDKLYEKNKCTFNKRVFYELMKEDFDLFIEQYGDINSNMEKILYDLEHNDYELKYSYMNDIYVENIKKYHEAKQNFQKKKEDDEWWW